ncbi:MAG: MepB family protein [Ottowia sp.]|nr:MepB family protein [Ottowia sp.]
MKPKLFEVTNVETLINHIYAPAGMTHSGPIVEDIESAHYSGCRFQLNGRTIIFRVAKTTPTKLGQFVTLWKRPQPGSAIAPFDEHDAIDFFIVCTSNTTHHGQFIFDKNILIKNGVLSSSAHMGKRALRVYPPCSRPLSKEAIRTQKWQSPYFLPLSKEDHADLTLTRQLFKQSEIY